MATSRVPAKSRITTVEAAKGLTLTHVGTIGTLIDHLSTDSNQRGKQFECICKWFLTHDPVYSHRLKHVWLWNDWPARWGTDAGIDLVAEDTDGRLWAVQTKAFAATHAVTKPDFDQFLAEASRPEFSFRLLIATTNLIGTSAKQTIDAQRGTLSLLLLGDLEAAHVDWPASLNEL